MKAKGIVTDKGDFNRWIKKANCSRKQKAQYQVRGKSGKPVTNIIPYGFKKDPEEKHHWLVDEEAADVVRRIFRMSIEGKGPLTIAKILMADKVERPSYYLAQRGRGTCQSKTDMSRPYDWTDATIRDILAKPEYMATRLISAPASPPIRTRNRQNARQRNG